MLDFTKPVNISLVVIVTFLVSMGILYLAKPSWIQKLDAKGKAVISYTLAISYSLTFALASGVATLLLSPKEKRTSHKISEPSSSMFPSVTAAQAF